MTLERHYPDHVTMRTKIKRALWNITSAILFRPFITKLFRPWRITLLKIFGADIEKDAEVYASAKIWAPWNLRMGHRACLGPDVICYNQDTVTLGDDAIVSQYSFICTAGHDVKMMNTADKSLITAPVILENGAWIGAMAFIGLGVRIGRNAIVGATASVYKDVEAMTIVGGNPARFIKKREMKEE